jgi:hypothetical protein
MWSRKIPAKSYFEELYVLIKSSVWACWEIMSMELNIAIGARNRGKRKGEWPTAPRTLETMEILENASENQEYSGRFGVLLLLLKVY